MKNKSVLVVILFSFSFFGNFAFSKFPKKVKLKDLSIQEKTRDADGRTIIKDAGRRPQSINTDTDEEIKLRHERLKAFSDRMIDLRDRK